MKHGTRLVSIVSVLAAGLVLASALQAQIANKTTGGTLEFQVISGASFDKDKVLPVDFLWHPEPGPEDATFQVTAECRRRNRLGGPPGGNNRVLFDLAMAPIASGEEYELGRKRRKLSRDGVQTSAAIWSGSELETIATKGLEEGVLVRLEISVRRGGLSFGDVVTCECRVAETGPRGIAISTGAEAARAANS